MDEEFIEAIQQDPFTMYVYKNLSFEIQNCNDTFLELAGYQSTKDVKGLTDDELAWKPFANIYRQHEINALNGLDYTAFIPSLDCNNKFRVYIEEKIPDVNHKGYIIGLHTIATEVVGVDQLTNNKAALTSKELICLFYLVRRYSAKKIAHILNNSPRTIEKHISNLKRKLNCSSHEELIQIAMQKKLFSLNSDLELKRTA